MRKNHSLIISLLLVCCAAAFLFYSFQQRQKTIFPKNANTRKDISINREQKPIYAFTKEPVVVAYLKEKRRLPDYYITKTAARKKGWVASQGNLCNVLPGKAIGGDYFTNREKKLPMKKNRIWYEADLNYNCGRRNADRVLFSNDGHVYVTHNHYKSFQER